MLLVMLLSLEIDNDVNANLLDKVLDGVIDVAVIRCSKHLQDIVALKSVDVAVIGDRVAELSEGIASMITSIVGGVLSTI